MFWPILAAVIGVTLASIGVVAFVISSAWWPRMTDEKRTVLYFVAMLGVCVLAVAVSLGIGYLSDDDVFFGVAYILIPAVFWGVLLLLSKLENRRRAH